MKQKLMFKVVMVALALFATCGLGSAATFDMTGPYLNVGISNTGGLIDDNYNVGLQFDPTGKANFTNAPDILKPGSPFEFYAVGVNGVDMGPTGFIWSGSPSVPAPYGQPVNTNYMMSTISAGPLLASTAGLVGGLSITTQTTLVSGKDVLFNVNFFNISGAPLAVQYARGLDPDPDYGQYGSFSTVNSISAGKVTALGPLSGISISIVDLTGGGVPTIQSSWATDLATLSIPQAAGNYGNTDSTINMYWNLGTIAPFQSKELSFEYAVSAVPLPPSLMLFAPGLFGLVGLRKRFFG